MQIIEVKERNDKLIKELVNLWEETVRNTHLFLESEEILRIKEYVPTAIKEIPHLIIVEDKNIPLGFIGINNYKVEMLFIKNSFRGKGLGKSLLNYGIKKYNINELTVNEQNKEAKKFYEHTGFKTYKRQELDELGLPYPILYMKLEK